MVAVVKEKFKYDDALDAFIALYGDWHQLWIQVVATVVSIIYSIIVTYIIFKVVDKSVGVRVDKRVEEKGLDIYEHGESAYSNYLRFPQVSL